MVPPRRSSTSNRTRFVSHNNATRKAHPDCSIRHTVVISIIFVGFGTMRGNDHPFHADSCSLPSIQSSSSLFRGTQGGEFANEGGSLDSQRDTVMRDRRTYTGGQIMPSPSLRTSGAFRRVQTSDTTTQPESLAWVQRQGYEAYERQASRVALVSTSNNELISERPYNHVLRFNMNRPEAPQNDSSALRAQQEVNDSGASHAFSERMRILHIISSALDLVDGCDDDFSLLDEPSLADEESVNDSSSGEEDNGASVTAYPSQTMIGHHSHRSSSAAHNQRRSSKKRSRKGICLSPRQ